MEQYDVSVRLEDEDASLIPQLVPYNRPSVSWQSGGGKLSLVCEMEQNPPGLIAWTTLEPIVGRLESTGATASFLRHEDGHEALIDFTSRLNNELTITVHGEYPAHFMSLLRDGLERLIKNRWPYLVYELYVPCPNRDNEHHCMGRFKLRTLYMAFAKRKQTRECDECLEEVSISQLLEGYVTSEIPLSRQLADMEIKITTELQEAKKDRQFYAAQSSESSVSLGQSFLDEAKNGPRLYSLDPLEFSRWDLRKLDPRNSFGEQLILTLWCEHPGEEHALGREGIYTFRNPKQWVNKIAPYTLLVTKVLQIAAPFSYGAATVAESAFENTFKFMEELSKSAAALNPDIEEVAKRRSSHILISYTS